MQPGFFNVCPVPDLNRKSLTAAHAAAVFPESGDVIHIDQHALVDQQKPLVPGKGIGKV